MAKKFSISEGMLNGISKNVKGVETLDAKENFRFEYIEIEKIKRNEKNFYEIVDIESLAEDIKLNGLNHNLVVRKKDEQNYQIISGERRFTAIKKLLEEGFKEFKLVPCKIIERNDIDSEIILIQANAQSRELTESEKLKQVERLQELYKLKKKNGEKIPGKIRELIAKDLDLSPTQVGRYTRINNKLIPELKTIVEEGSLSVSNASEFATLSKENQKVISNMLGDDISLSKEEAVTLKNELKKVEEEKEIELKKELENKVENKDFALKELDLKYDNKIEDITNKTKESNLEKKELKEILNARETTDIEKENLILTKNIKKIETSIKNLKAQFDKMKNQNIEILEENKIEEFLEKYQNLFKEFNSQK